MARLLIIEDEAELLHALEQLFTHDGYEVTTAADGERALWLFGRERFDLVIVDVLLPKIDGFAVCRAIRRGSDVPIIVTTALGDEAHQLQGFSLLADDYVTKPYSLGVVRERVRAVLRRCAGGRGGSYVAAYGDGQRRRDNAERTGVLGFGAIRVDPEAREVTYDGEVVNLTRTEFDILHLLAEHPRRVFTRDTLARQIWGYSDDSGDKAINIHIMNLRRKLGADSIDTVRGVGYRAGHAEDGHARI